jgi:hypothetical protein
MSHQDKIPIDKILFYIQIQDPKIKIKLEITFYWIYWLVYLE